MGQGMAGRLLSAGHTLSVYNRTPEKALDLVESGAYLAETPRAAADAGFGAFSESKVIDFLGEK